MGTGGSGGSSSTSQPWKIQQPFLKQIYGEAKRLYPTELPYYPGDTVASRDPSYAKGLSAIESRAVGGNPNLGAAEALAGREIAGDYLNSNPWIDAVYDRAAQAVSRNYQQAVMPAVESGFEGAGRYGSGAHLAATREANRSLGENLSNLATDIYGRNYEAERSRQGAAVDRLASLDALGYAPGEHLIGAGAESEAYQQRLIDAAIQRYEYGQQEPWQRLGIYSNAIGAPVITSSQSSWGPGVGMQLLSAI